MWQQALTCPQCGEELAFVNGTSNGLLAVTITHCLPCGRSWEITSRLRPFTRPESIRRHDLRKKAAA